jgi:hypothetical protein
MRVLPTLSYWMWSVSGLSLMPTSAPPELTAMTGDELLRWRLAAARRAEAEELPIRGAMRVMKDMENEAMEVGRSSSGFEGGCSGQ